MLCFDCALNKNWRLYLDHSENYLPNLTSLYGTLNSSYPLFVKYLPFDENRELNIINPTITGPVYFQESENIFLAVHDGICEQQFIFQLAHELCHFVIKRTDLNAPLLWFEEVLCDVSSMFFLLKMRENQTYKDNQSWLDYYNNLFKPPFITPVPLNEKMVLGINDREKQRFVAMQLIPIFIQYPSFWKELVHFSEAKSTNLPELFLELSEAVQPSSLVPLKMIADIFE